MIAVISGTNRPDSKYLKVARIVESKLTDLGQHTRIGERRAT